MKPSFSSIGICDLDTSHPLVWIPLLKERGVAIFVFDEGWTTPPEFHRRFCEAHGIILCDSWATFLERSEVVALMGANFDRHVPLARSAMEAGRTVFIDKPVACGDVDLEEIASWAGRRLVLGSSARYSPELLTLREMREEVAGLISTIGSQEPFCYAIHGVEMGQTVLGPGASRVRCIHETRPVTFQVEHASGALWLVQIRNPHRLFEVSAQLSGERRLVTIPGGTLHGRLIAEVARVHEGGEPLVTPAEAVEAIRILRAGHTSLRDGGRWVALNEPLVAFCGEAYCTEYRKQDPFKARLAALMEP